MPSTSILLLVPALPETLDAFEAKGVTFPVAVVAGSAAEVRFEGLGSGDIDALCECLDREGLPHLVLTQARFDPSMCMPGPATVRIACAGISPDERSRRLPLRFDRPALDVRTLVATGLGEAESLAVLARFEGPEAALAA